MLPDRAEADFHLLCFPAEPTVPPQAFANLSQLNFETLQTLYCYGSWICSQFSQISEWLKKDPHHRLILLEDKIGTLAALRETAVWDHPQVVIRVALLPQGWDMILEECAQLFSHPQFAVVALDSYKKEKASIFRKISLLIQRKTLLWQALFSEALHPDLFFRNVFHNFTKLPHAFNVNRMRGSFKDVPAIICGAGPTLSQSSAFLKRCEDRALILGGGSTLSALSHLGIRPHLGLAIDPNPKEFECIKNCAAKDIPLIFCGRLLPKVFEHFVGPYGYLRSGSGGALEAYLEEKLKLDDPHIGPDLGREALSVTTMALSLAHALGCNPIYFAGVDLSYTSKRLYAAGVAPQEILALSDQKILLRKGKKEKRVPTTLKWIMERDTLASFAKNHPSRLFFQTPHSGLHIPFIAQLSEEVFEKKYAACPLNLHQRLAEQIAKNQFHITPDTIKTLYQELYKSLETCLSIASAVVDEGITPRTIVYESDLKEELAFKVLLQEFWWAYPQVAKKDGLALWQELKNKASAYCAESAR